MTPSQALVIRSGGRWAPNADDAAPADGRGLAETIRRRRLGWKKIQNFGMDP